MNNKLKVLFVAAECAPLVKVGGLGDVAGELPLKLKELGADVRMVIPGNRDIDAPTEYKGDYPVNMVWRNETCIVREVLKTPVTTYIIDNHHYFGRSGVYGHRDDAERFAFFCSAVYEMIRRFDFMPDILHLNDWHTAPLAMLIRENEREHQELSRISILYTIHNLEYQGISGREIFHMFNVKDVVFKVDKVEYFGCFNAMKAGINYADMINAVSKTSSRQMLTKRFGFGLEGVLKNRKTCIRGVTNGINTQYWNPETDKLIYAPYHPGDLTGKKINKEKLQEEFGLEKSDVPIFSVVSRLVPNKGLGLMEGAAEFLLKKGCQFVLLGSGEKYYEKAFMNMMERYPGKASANLEYNNEKAHRIYAGSDVLLMPSWYEPCGISQLIAMRYGTVPIVHKTGGLADTVTDEIINEGEGTGFAFGAYSLNSLLKVMDKALDYYKDRAKWECLVGRAMMRDSSWESAAKEYLELYQEAITENKKRKTRGRKNRLEKERKGSSRSE